jgi:hypothetical protein
MCAVALVVTATTACGGDLAVDELDAVLIERAEPGPSGGSATDLVPDDPDPADGTAEDGDEGEGADGLGDGSDVAATDTADDDVGDGEDGERAAAAGSAESADEGKGAHPSTAADDHRDAVAAGPTDAAIARFVASTTRQAVDSYHRVVDVTGDGIRDVAVGLVTVDGDLELVLGRWDGDTVGEAGRVAWEGATDVGVIATRDVVGDGRLELLLPHRDRRHHGVLAAVVSRDGRLTIPGACPGAAPGRHALDFGDGTRAVTLACDRKDHHGKDGLVWSDGVFLGAAAVGSQARSGHDG